MRATTSTVIAAAAWAYLAQGLSVVTGVGPHDLQRGERVEQADEQEFRTGLVADGRGGDDQREQPALGVDGEVPAAAGDLFAAVVAAGRRGTVSCALTICESMMQAVGCAARPWCAAAAPAAG